MKPDPRPHRPGEGNAPTASLVVLGSHDYDRYAEQHDGHLPYRLDTLSNVGFDVRWTVGHLRGRYAAGRVGRVVRRSESLLTPWAQTWASRGERRRAAAVLAIFESEGHGLAARRLLPWGHASRTPLIIVACWLADLLHAGGRSRRLLYRLLYRGVDRVVVFSSNQVSTLERLAGIPRDRIVVARFGVDLDELASVPVSESGSIVAAGRDLGRDWATLFRAAAGTGWNVELITRSSQIAGLEVPREVRPLETMDRPDYLARLASATVVTIPTEVREYPTGQTVLLEAMALGKACVVSDTPAMREYVVDGHTGVLVPPHDPLALQRAVDRLLGDAAERRRIGDAARAASQASGGATEMWERIGAAVAEVIADASPS